MDTTGRTHGLPFWDDDKAAVCAAIEARPARLKIVLKSKNETEFLDEWIAYHAAIVGIENLIIFDNMSTDEAVLKKYQAYARDLVVVRYKGFHPLLHVVNAFPQLYEALARSCDHVVFLDSDEFLSVFDRGRHAAGTAVADFILSAGSFDILPGMWLENLPRSRTIFDCGTSLTKFEWGLRWGKPALRTKAPLQGIVQHNTQAIASLGRPGTPLNLMVLHMKSLFPGQRRRVNIAKLANRGFCAPTDTAEEIVAKDLSGITDTMIHAYVAELKQLLSETPDRQPSLVAGTLELAADGRIQFHGAQEERLLARYLGRDGQRILAQCAEFERDGESGGAPGRPAAWRLRGPAHPAVQAAATAATPAPAMAAPAAPTPAPAPATAALAPAAPTPEATLAWELLQSGRLDEAEAVCTAALQHEPGQPEMLLRLGLIARRRGDREAAIARFRDALRLHPGHGWASLELAMDLLETGRLDEAEAACRALLQAQPDNTHARIRLGLVARRRGDHVAAIEHFEDALQTAPGNAWILKELETERRKAAIRDTSETHGDTEKTSDEDPAEPAMTDRVFRSRNNFLYLTGGTNAASRLYTRTGFEASIDAKGWGRVIEERARRCAAAGIQFRQLIIPEKLTVLPLEETDRKAVFGRAKDIMAPGERLLPSVPSEPTVYPKDYLVAQSARFPVYPATDSHWTWTGAFSAFQLLISRCGIELDYQPLLQVPRTSHSYHGDLWNEGMADIERDRFERLRLPAPIRRIYCNAIVGTKERYDAVNDVGLHVGSHCVFHNPDAQRHETVVLFGTSFSEYRLEPSLLTAIFAFFFDTVHFVWSTSLDFGYIERHAPDLVVAELPERFLTYCPDDRLELEAFTAERIAAWRASRPAG